MRKLEKLQVNNGAMIAMDYQTGEIARLRRQRRLLPRRRPRPQFQPQFDVLGDGWRQPGSAFKPFNYVTGINDGTMTAASMFMDVTTTFDNSGGYTPKDYDLLERGPVRMRTRAPVVDQHPRRQGARRSTASTTSSPRRRSSA